MHFYRPKSFLRLVVMGFALVCLPLLLALLQAQWAMDSLAGKSSEVVDRSVKATEGSRLLVEDLIALERKARQYEVLGEKRLLQEMVEQHKQIQDIINRLLQLGLSSPLPQLLTQIIKQEAGIFDQLQNEAIDSRSHEEALQGFALLNEQANTIAYESNALIYNEMDRIQQATVLTRQTLLLWVLALVPTSLLFMVLFVRLISRPIKQIEDAIDRLGKGDFKTPVAVGGAKDLVSLGERLDWTRNQLAEVDRSKTKFVSRISHELKTPLASIREGADLLNDGIAGELNGQQKEIVGILCKSSRNLQKLIENLLGFSKFQAGVNAMLELTPVTVPTLVTSVLADHKPLLMKKQVRCEINLKPLTVNADPTRLRTLIDNLISNAVKFTPPRGKITVNGGRNQSHWFLEVIDSGPGIAPEDRKRVFQPFFRGRQPSAGNVKGTGLGLAIAQEIARAHGGDLSLPESSEPGGRIRLTLPLSGTKDLLV